MTLPSFGEAHAEVEVEGHTFTVYRLNRQEALQVAESSEAGQGAIECRLLALALREDYDELVEWYATAPAGVIQQLVAASIELAGLDDLGKGSSAA